MEDFWTEIKRIVYDGGWEAESLDQLRNRIDYAFKKISMELVHRLGKASYTRVDAILIFLIYRAYARFLKFYLPNKKYLLDT